MCDKKDNAKKWQKYCTLACLGCLISLFTVATTLIRVRQNILSSGRKLSAVEKKIECLSSQNAEIDAKISQLTSPASLRELMRNSNFITATKENIEKISKMEVSFYAATRGHQNSANALALEKFHKQAKPIRDN